VSRLIAPARLAIIAGEGQLVLEVARAAAAAGWEVQIFLLVEQTSGHLLRCACPTLSRR